MDRKCGCKGIRTCLLCETVDGMKDTTEKLQDRPDALFVMCLKCRGIYEENKKSQEKCSDHNQFALEGLISGIELCQNFVTSEEEQLLLNRMNEFPWVQSQSGRVKQDFGPKVNFKKQKVNLDSFKGFPKYMNVVKERLKQVPSLRDFEPVELCNLRYEPERGSAIDPHLDDSWLWGPRLVTLNLSSSTVLTLLSPSTSDGNRTVLRIPLPAKSLLILSGLARSVWKHAIFREDIQSARVAVTWRELSREFSTGGSHESLGVSLLDRAKESIDTPSSS